MLTKHLEMIDVWNRRVVSGAPLDRDRPRARRAALREPARSGTCSAAPRRRSALTYAPPAIAALLPALILTSLSLATTMLAPRGAAAQLILNEVRTKPGGRMVEVKNIGGAPEELANWGARTSLQTVNPIGTGQLPAGHVYTFTIDMRSRGDCIELFDAGQRTTVDMLFYGDTGGGPHDIEMLPMSTIARFDENPDPSGEFSAERWNLDFEGTLGQPNDVRPAMLGGSLVINEVLPGPGNDVNIELWNGTPVPVLLIGWFLTSGESLVPVGDDILGPGAFHVVNVLDLSFEYSFNAYLMAADSTRVDQIGLVDAPGDSTTYWNALLAGQSFQRMPDGAGPNNGYDLPSSGFPYELRLCLPTPGLPNCLINGVNGASRLPFIGELRVAPNPFNPLTTIHYTLERSAYVRLTAFDVTGRRLETLFEGPAPAGRHEVSWALGGEAGAGDSGVYFIRLTADGAERVIKAVVAK